MWLLDTETYELHEFVGHRVPAYAILSHRWGSPAEEVSFKEYRKGAKVDSPGHEKIRRFCDEVRDRDIKWGWVDTCCIDKRSSAELSEAINSMYHWYANAETCFVYMSDVSVKGAGNERDEADEGGEFEYWGKSKWWERGWTLQELIAPKKVEFFDGAWCNFGNRRAMAPRIAKRTGIPEEVLVDKSKLTSWCIAQKMSWAVGRKTTRIEDRAYSLLGIFQLNMPLLYGEGAAAFQRLQLRLLEKYPDESLFAWLPLGPEPHDLLAGSPNDFEDCPVLQSPDEPGAMACHPDFRRENPPRATSWGIEMTVAARRLKPRRPYWYNGRWQKFLLAFSPAIGRNDGMQELPCTLVLVQSGPAPFSYQRYDCLYGEPQSCLDQLSGDFICEEIEPGFLIYLRFDDYV